MSHQFLSPEWVAAATELRAEVGDLGPAPVAVVMNLTITDVPFGDSPTVQAHLNTANGPMALDYGHLPSPSLSVTIDWLTAKALLIEGNPQAAMSAFMNGKIKVEGDMSALLALQNAPPTPEARAVMEHLRAMTA